MMPFAVLGRVKKSTQIFFSREFRNVANYVFLVLIFGAKKTVVALFFSSLLQLCQEVETDLDVDGDVHLREALQFPLLHQDVHRLQDLPHCEQCKADDWKYDSA